MKSIRLILTLLLLLCCFSAAVAEDISERVFIATSTATPEPLEPVATAAPARNIVKKSVSGKVTRAPQATATPAPAGVYVQDPIAFGEGVLSLYANEDNEYCKRNSYLVTGMSGKAFADAYAEICKNNPAMSYYEMSVSPSGWVYHCFTSAPGQAYDEFITSSGEWTTASMCLSLSYHENSDYITLRYSHDFELADLSYRLTTATPTPEVKSSSFTSKITSGKISSIGKNRATATPTVVPTVAPTPVPTAVPATAAPISSGKVSIVSGNSAKPSQAADDAFTAFKETWLSEHQYYYQQLSPQHKTAWEEVMRNVFSFPNQRPLPSRSYYRTALAPMIKDDNPRIFWIDWVDSNGRLRYETGSTANYKVVEFPQGETLASLQETFLKGIDDAVASIKKTLPKNASTRDTVKAIHDWMCKNNSYNDKQTTTYKKDSDPVAFAFLAAHSAYSAIIPGDAYEPVCEGYAGAFQVLCEEFGIEALVISGYAPSGTSHAWNYVQLDDNQWYLVDVDADDLASSYVHTYFLLDAAKVKKLGYKHEPYLTSGVRPESGYVNESAAFTVPELAK